MYFKAHVYGIPNTGNLCISYGADQFVRSTDNKRPMSGSFYRNKKMVDLKICFSNTGVIEPSDRECNKCYLNPQGKFKLPCQPGRDSYEQEWLFFQLYSSTGCTINMNLSFGDDDRPVVAKREKKLIDFSIVEEDDLPVIKNYKKYMKK